MTDDKLETHMGLCYCTQCKTVKFGVELTPKAYLQKHEIAQPTDGGFHAICAICAPNKLITGIIEVLTNGKLMASTVHHPLKAALHLPDDIEERKKKGLHVEIEERMRPVAPTATQEPRKDPEPPEGPKTL